MTLLAEVRQVARDAEQLYGAEAVADTARGLAESISRSAGECDILLLCVLNGGLVATGLIMPHLTCSVRLDYVHATRYRDRLQGDQLRLLAAPTSDLTGQYVVVVDDIFDEGYTLQAVQDYCYEKGAAQVKSAVLVNKKHNRKAPGFSPDYVGLEVPDRYVFGSGMDYKGYLRNLPGVYALAEPNG